MEGNAANLAGGASILAAIFAAQTAFAFARNFLLSWIGEQVVADLRADLYSHLTKLSAGFFTTQRVGELTSRMASDVTVVQTVTTGSLAEFIRQALMLVGGVAIIIATSAQLTALMLIVVPVVVGLGVL